MAPSNTPARLARTRVALERAGADWLLIPPSADFRWLTGVVARSTERLVTLAVGRDGRTFCLVPRLESEALGAECPWLELEVWDESEAPLARLARRIELERKHALLLGEGFRTAPLLALAERAACRPGAQVLEPLRARQDGNEL